ncbi:S8 family serine peptidase [Actinokineospora sp. HUAS TT18]|uniref:S8 family peptidase n=1 Tax=Actinokineospora sp. HUAS TT18 TaxID=3447451 RepID=UPI003F528F0D
MPLHTKLVAALAALTLAAPLSPPAHATPADPTDPATSTPPSNTPSPSTVAATPAPSTAPPSGYVGDVTLITGDRVTVRRVGTRLVPAVDPAPGREHVHFAITGDATHLHVIPDDAWHGLNAGTLDHRLFDVAALLRTGYGDDRSPDVPLIIETQTASNSPASAHHAADGAGSGQRAQGAAAAVPSTDRAAGGDQAVEASAGVREFVAVRQPKDTAADAWVSRRAGGRVWLDGMRYPSLDVSVPQVGAPAAWAAGYTGQGVKVAVLDTGVDATHADLRGRVAAEKNFTADSARDEDGHGTHVAATIASRGTYRGVAPDARLLVGKVCGGAGCPESAIIAGMRWAVDSGAKVVNLSLGGPDAAGEDPLEAAVNQLSDRALFVVAAGNDGSSGPETVASPASADGALAVGAVDKDDNLAGFSSRGPRIHDAALKPDILAPGVDITAARSRYSFGKPKEKHRDLSGTSMATPHVSGAAAVLAQQHPEWTGRQLKAALMASAKPIDAGSYDQGAGRVDLARGVTQSVYASPPSVSMGRQSWPHDDDPVVTKSFSYTNTSAQPVELRLTLSTDAPTGTFRLSTDHITVPAHGTASVEITADTKVDAPEGPLSARVDAEAGAQRVTVPVAVDREPESYDLTFRTVDRDGELSDYNYSFLLGIEPSRYRPVPTIGGVGVVRVRKGRYHLDSVINTRRPDGVTADSHKVVIPTVEVTTDKTVTLDAQAAQPISVTFDRQGVRPKAVGAGYSRISGERAVFTGVLGDTFERIFIGQVGDPLPDSQFVADIGGAWAIPDRDGNITASPVAYHLQWFDYGHLPNGFTRHVVDRDLARLHTTYREQADKRGATKVWIAKEPRYSTSVGYGLPLTLPQVRTEFHNVDDLTWFAELQQWRKVKKALRTETVVTSGELTHPTGVSTEDQWNSAVFGPGFRPGDWAYRSHDTLIASLPLYADAGLGRTGLSAVDGGSTVLYREGVEVGRSDTPGQGSFDVPPEPARYRLETTTTRSVVSTFSTSISCVWTFTSARPPEKGKGGVPLPLMAVRFAPEGLDLHNRVGADRARVPVAVQWHPGAEHTLTALTVEASFDDGRTWRPVPITDGAATIDHPRTARYVSLRARATDSDGNTVEQTTIRAYGA